MRPRVYVCVHACRHTYQAHIPSTHTVHTTFRAIEREDMPSPLLPTLRRLGLISIGVPEHAEKDGPILFEDDGGD